jgi:hypothetical protein
MGMRIPTLLVVSVVSLGLLGAACTDDDTPLTTGDGQDGGADTSGATPTVPDRAADLSGTITSVAPFVPITEDCTPPDDLDPDGAVSNEDPPICTDENNDILGTVLVEEDPADPNGGRKVSFTVTTASALDGVDDFDDLAEGDQVDAWIGGDACAESYPEQCALAALRVTETVRG